MQEELGVKPDKGTQALNQQIQADEVDISSQPPNGISLAGLPQVLKRLQHLQTTLTDFQRQVQQDIQSVELALKDQGDDEPLTDIK